MANTILREPTGLAASDGTSNGSATPKVHLGYLDGVRALAATWVVFGHWWLLQNTVMSGWRGLFVNWISYVHFAVDAFIVLSGFCLILPVSRKGQLSGGAVAFYTRRARRILPPYFAALLVASASCLFIQHFGHHGKHMVTTKTFLGNALLLQDWLPSLNTICLPFWSIAVEWKIYFLLPLFVIVLQRFGTPAMLTLGAVIGAAITVLLYRLYPGSTLLFTCPWFVFLFTMGLATGHACFSPTIQVRPKWQWLFAIFLVASAIVVHQYPITLQSNEDFNRHLPLIDVLVGGTCACLFALMSTEHKLGIIARNVVSARPLVFVGTYAYSLYLTHRPILDVSRILINKLLGHHSAFEHAGEGLIGIPLAFGLAYLFFLMFEKPFLVKRAHETVAEVERDAALSPAP